ncbi:hypothetical protein Tco_0176010, partial [Tanacetum coccineum]
MLKDHPLKNMEDRGIFDSGCSGHMTGNKDHLDDFEEYKAFTEDEEPEDQWRIFKDIDDDPLVSFVTPTKPSGEAQEEEISPMI